MPFKIHEARRHHIPKARYRVRNWSECDRGLIRRGDIRVWLSEEALPGWRASCRSTPGGQRHFSNLAVEAVLTLSALNRLPLRQSVAFRSLADGLDATRSSVPDHKTLAQRRCTLEVVEYRWPRKGPVDLVIDSTGLKFLRCYLVWRWKLDCRVPTCHIAPYRGRLDLNCNANLPRSGSREFIAKAVPLVRPSRRHQRKPEAAI